ncbi:MAG: DUF413 domain-containing protein [Pseudomonadota bacterium]
MLPRDHYLKQAFQDAVHFPDGFEKGGLSDIQARLIRKHGTLISALSIDEVSDATPEDLHILKVIANQSAPKSPVEQAWVKYLAIVKNLASTSKGKPVKAKAVKAAVEAPAEPENIEATKPAASPTKTTAKPEAAKPKTTKAESAKTAVAANKPEKKTTTKK